MFVLWEIYRGLVWSFQVAISGHFCSVHTPCSWLVFWSLFCIGDHYIWCNKWCQSQCLISIRRVLLMLHPFWESSCFEAILGILFYSIQGFWPTGKESRIEIVEKKLATNDKEITNLQKLQNALVTDIQEMKIKVDPDFNPERTNVIIKPPR